MITLTRLNDVPIVVNAELIRSIEQKPDSVITMINGDHIIVREDLGEIVTRTVAYGRHLRRLESPS